MTALRIEIGWAGGAIERVELRSHRPDTSRLLPGRTPAEALALLGRLYAVCGQAQRAAAELALGAALARPPSVARREELLRECAREAVQEHLWRVLVDWPKKLGLAPAQDRFAYWYRRCAGADAAWPADLRTELAGSWLACPVDAIDAWHQLGAYEAWCARTEPALAPLFRALRAAAPEQSGAAPSADETGPVVQHAEHPWIAALLASARPLEARVAARLVGLVALAGNLAHCGDPDAETEFDADSPAAGRGRAVVTTARGVLVHDVRTDGERIASYSIHTPTDCNFAAHGAYVAHVQGRAARSAEEAVRVADLWALALDPCVPYAVSLAGSAGHA
jgi:hypothetical protein